MATVIPKNESFLILDQYRESILSFCVLSSFLLICFSSLKKEYTITFNFWDLPLALLCLFIFLSLCWTHHLAVTLKSASHWTLIFCFYKLYTILFQREDAIKLVALTFASAVILNLLYFIPQLGLERSRSDLSYNLFLSLLACLSPFLITNFKLKIPQVLGLIAFIILSFVIIQKDAQGAKLALFMGIGLYISSYIAKWFKIKPIYLFVMLVILLFGGLYFNTQYNWIREISKFSDALGMNDRIIMWERCIDIFKEHSILGIGAENLKFLIYEEKMEGMYMGPMALNFFMFNHPHNLFFALLPELGLVGFTAFLFVFAIPAFLKINENLGGKESEGFIIALFITLMISSVYIVVSDSRFLLLAGVFVAYLNKDSKTISSHSFIPYFFILIAAASLVWHTVIDHTQRNLKNTLENKSLTSTEKSNYIEELLMKDFLWIQYKGRPLLTHAINQLNEKKKLTKDEKFLLGQYYQQFLEIDPYNMRLLYQYALNLYRKGELFKAKKLLMNGLKIDDSNFYIKLLLAKIEFEFGNYQYADILLNFRSKVFEKVYKLEQKREWDDDFRYGSNEKSFIKTNEEIAILKRKIRGKLKQEKNRKN